MTEITEENSMLNDFLKNKCASWYVKLENLMRIEQLSKQEKHALFRMLSSEDEGKGSFKNRTKYYSDLSFFNFELNQLAGELIAELSYELEKKGDPEDHIDIDYSFFPYMPSQDVRNQVVKTINEKGYCVSPLSLDSVQLQTIFSTLALSQFKAKSLHSKALSGKEIFDILRLSQFKAKSLHSKALSGKEIFDILRAENTSQVNVEETYWLIDQDALAHQKELIRLAFDPYIISVVTDYFGCTPIHVQTNAWFSFPGENTKNKLSANAQLFHQDKEFIKFLKIFIYLTDVDEDSGPHCYIESSHLDELHNKGPKLSERITDDEIGKYYASSRARTLLGPAGMLVFGDTSCVHKGTPVKQGHRIMLQLEYASSLYLSPVQPFNDLPERSMLSKCYSNGVIERLTKNYNSEERKQFDALFFSSAGIGKKRKIINLLRYLKEKLIA